MNALVKRLGRPALAILAALVLVNAAIVIAYALGLRVNTTASMPLGVYRLAPYHSGPIVRDTLVAFCPPESLRALAVPRGYLGPGSCPGNVEPLLKHAAAVAGDRIDVDADAVRVNGLVLPRSARLSHDCNGAPLPHIAPGRYALGAHSVWLYAPVARSWDSRYYGAQSTTHIVGIATPVLIVGEGRACAG